MLTCRLVDTGATELLDESHGQPKRTRPVYDVAGCIEFLRFWLCSLYMHARGAKALLIGTHVDALTSKPQQLRTVHEELERAFGVDTASSGSGMLLGQGHNRLDLEWNFEDDLCFFPVDNTRATPADVAVIDRLKGKVDDILQEVCSPPLPLSSRLSPVLLPPPLLTSSHLSSPLLSSTFAGGVCAPPHPSDVVRATRRASSQGERKGLRDAPRRRRRPRTPPAR